MTQEHSLEVAAFANSLHALLSTSPPLLTSLGANGASSSLPLLAQLLQPSFLNGQEEEHSVWHALQQLPAPTSSSTSPTAPSTNTASAPPSPYLALASVGAPHDLGHLEIVDDGSCCISCPLNVSSAEEIQLTPHFITLAELPRAEGTAGERKDDKEKWWAPHWSKGKTEGETKRTLAKKTFQPPQDKLSVLVAWWGYQIFLPAAVNKQLGSDVEPYIDTISALSTALSFIASRAPQILLLVPGGNLLALGVPIIAAISSSFTFAWKFIKSKDRGEGIILAATWVLPFALVPRGLEMKLYAEKGGDPQLVLVSAEGERAVEHEAECVSEEVAVARKKSVSFAEEEHPLPAPVAKKKGGLFRRVTGRRGKDRA